MKIMVSELQNRFDILFEGLRRPRPGFDIVDGSKLNQTAVGVPVFIAAECAALRIGRIAVDPGELKRL